MTRKQKRLILFTLFLSLSALLSACGSKKPAPGPMLLLVDSESVPSINEILGDEAGTFISSDPTVEHGLFLKSNSKGDTPEDSTTAVEPQTYTYLYADLAEGGRTIEAYMRGLIDAEVGFLVVNSSGSRATPPDFSAKQGSLTLTRANLHQRKNLWLTLGWDDTDLTMTASLRDATPEGTPGAGTESSLEALAADGAVNFLYGLPPSVLTLPGDSMKQYQIYFNEGTVEVNGSTCLRLSIYEIGEPAGTNNFVAIYLLACNRSKLYRLDATLTEPTELPLP